MRGLRVILYFCFAAAVGLVGWLVPVYLNAVDVAVLKEHGRRSPRLEDLAAQLLQNLRHPALPVIKEIPHPLFGYNN